MVAALDVEFALLLVQYSKARVSITGMFNRGNLRDTLCSAHSVTAKDVLLDAGLKQGQSGPLQALTLLSVAGLKLLERVVECTNSAFVLPAWV